MPNLFFEHTFKYLKTPIIICSDSEKYPVIYANPSAKLSFNPLHSTESLKTGGLKENLDAYMRFHEHGVEEYFWKTLQETGSIERFRTNIVNFEGKAMEVFLTANLAEFDSKRFFILYVFQIDQNELNVEHELANVLLTAFHMAYHIADVNEAINRILGLVGINEGVSRTYIFEEISSTHTANTYEWCNVGIDPAIAELHYLKKSDYNYDAIVSGGMYITNDVRDLPDNDRQILEAQGIKSLTIVPLIHEGKPLGYVGFDDCKHYRKWSSKEISLLQSISVILTALIVRRDLEEQSSRSYDILQTISDNTDNVIYVSNIESHEIIFVNKTLSDSLGKKPEELIGKICWQVLQENKTEPCEFCPLKKMLRSDGSIIHDDYVWEFQNTINQDWYLVHDAIIKWIDGSYVHIETATMITHQKKYEQQLKYYAYTDMMTGAHNRESGYRMIADMHEATVKGRVSDSSIVFFDIDNLKQVNDNFGHDSGDDMILRIVEIIRGKIRQSDKICRWGGDEFIILLQCDHQNAMRVMLGIDNALNLENESGVRPYELSISYGISELGGDFSKSVDEIITEADQKMYQNKQKAKKNR